MKFKLLSFLLTILCGLAFGQPEKYKQDVNSKEGIVNALYEVISGSAGEKRDWDRFRNLFLPESRLIPTRKSREGQFSLSAISPEEYIEMFSKNINTGFFEKELHHEVEEYGTIAHIFSIYETRESPNGVVTNRGINSIQLYKDDQRYYVINIFWCAESMGFPIPAKYLN
jgi:hypothetical protein